MCLLAGVFVYPCVCVLVWLCLISDLQVPVCTFVCACVCACLSACCRVHVCVCVSRFVYDDMSAICCHCVFVCSRV